MSPARNQKRDSVNLDEPLRGGRTKAQINAAKQERARLRRAVKVKDAALDKLYPQKPLSEWDVEELAKGRPRSADGSFRGKSLQYISRQTHEEAIRRFTAIAQSDMRALVPTALATVKLILTDDAVDEKGKPLVSMAVKLEAAKWVVEHLVGKPTQRIEADISVKLQGLLANVMVSPGEVGQAAIMAHSQESAASKVDLDED